MNRLKNIICSINSNLIEALNRLNESGKRILFIVNDNEEYIGVLTDGDIRRGLVRTNTLNLKIADLVNKKALTASYDDEPDNIIARIKAIKSSAEITIVPLLKNQKVVDYFEFYAGFYAPIASPVLEGNELSYIAECVSTNWISSQGKFVGQFEENFANKYEIDFAVSVTNGTAALHLALVALNIGYGDEVILPSLTFAATINAVLYTGAIPVIVDVEKESFCIDPNAIEQHISPKTKAIIPVHLYGQVCQMDKIMVIAQNHNLKVIEDCAEAQGAQFRNQFVGSMGDIGCFSFFGNKIMTTGEGGMCTTRRPELNQKMRLLRDHGMDKSKGAYYHSAIGFNYRMTNMQAAIGVAQLERIDDIQKKRLELEKAYVEHLKDYVCFIPQKSYDDRQKVCWLVSFLFEHPSFNRDSLINRLKKQNVDARPFFIPMHEMEIYKKYAKTECPNSSYLSQVGINFPTSVAFSENKLAETIQKIKSCL